MDRLAPSDPLAATQQGDTNYQNSVINTYDPPGEARTHPSIQPGERVIVTDREPDANDQNDYSANVTMAMDQTHESTTSKETLKEDMLQIWIGITSEIQHLLTQRRELAERGAVDTTAVCAYLDQLADFARQLAPLRGLLLQ